MILKKFLKVYFNRCFSLFDNLPFFPAFFDFIFDHSISRTITIKHGNTILTLSCPNALVRYRIKTFSAKEPETLSWIDSLTDSDILWDIGANIGLYSCYAASRNIRVFAFEPSYLNIHSLVSNISLNNLSASVTIVPLPLSDKIQISEFNSRFTRVGSALSSFSSTLGYDGLNFSPSVVYSIPGLTIDSFVDIFRHSLPSAIKIDVDGLEHLILSGGITVLHKVRTILIEVNDNFYDQSVSVKSTLESLGFVMVLKDHSEMIASSTPFSNTFNQIWTK